MCFKEWFHKPPIEMLPVKRRVISATINDYPGSINDLNGCNNDGKQVKEVLLNYWNDFDVIRFIDSKTTISNFKTTVAKAISLLKPGSTVLVLPDSCFSGTVTRFAGLYFVGEHPTRNRFYQQPGVPVRPPKIKAFVSKGDIKWIVISGCGETQYSADAYINGDYHGAFTWYAMNTLKPDITYRQWHKEICKYLPGTEYEQAPTIEGPDILLDRIVFKDDTLVIHNSTHGTQLAGVGGDEPTDEAICFYDGNLRDDDYYDLLNKIIL
jgi:hypothetical protein